ncbi:MAG: methyltransferase family protein [Acidobacteriota bacterium]
MNWLVELILRSAQKEYGRATKSFATAWGFILFEVLLPGSILLASLGVEHFVGIDQLLHLRFDVQIGVRLALFLPLLAVGQLFVIWTATDQLRLSGGTPAFKVPPKRLLVAGPFAYCRNPMVFGYLLYYYGLAFLFASPIALFGLCPALNLFALYVIVEVEEVELEHRFGADYLEYKARVNRMIPLPAPVRRLLRRRWERPDASAESVDPEQPGN